MTTDTIVGREGELIISFDAQSVLGVQEGEQPNNIAISPGAFEIIMEETVP